MEQLNNQLQVFNHEEFGKIRVALLNGKPNFNLFDICFDLGYTKSNAKGTLYLRKDKIENICESLDITGVAQSDTEIKITKDIDFENTFIKEEDFYDLSLESKAKHARKFRKWVTGTVLPTIRKTGGFVSNADLMVNTYFNSLDDNYKGLVKGLFLNIEEQQKQLQEKDIVIKKKDDELIYKNNVIEGITQEISLAEQRQILNRVVRQGTDYKKRYGELYTQFCLLHHLNLDRRIESYNEKYHQLSRSERKEQGIKKINSKMQYIDEVLNMIPELYEVAVKLYESDICKLSEELYGLRN